MESILGSGFTDINMSDLQHLLRFLETTKHQFGLTLECNRPVSWFVMEDEVIQALDRYAEKAGIVVECKLDDANCLERLVIHAYGFDQYEPTTPKPEPVPAKGKGKRK